MQYRLPMRLSRFIGREREIAAVDQLLSRSRLLTLTGAGGSGKTSLAEEVARHAAVRYQHGVLSIELAPLSNPDLLAQHVAGALGQLERGVRSPLELVLDRLRDRQLLLLLDNCEHLVGACAELVSAMLRECDQLTILTTSREPLGVDGERVWIVPPLSTPNVLDTNPAAITQAESVQLFLERAQAVLPSFGVTAANATAVAAICRQLDGLPLAIELAAARVRVLTPAQIAARLSDNFRLLTTGERGVVPRHRTLNAAIGWSFSLLRDSEQALLLRVAVFAGTFSIEAAEAVGKTAVDGEEVLDVLTALVDKSLVMVSADAATARYRLLETVRQFALDQLRSAGDYESARDAHARYFVSLAREADPHIYAGADDLAWRPRLNEELANLRAAADWLEQSPHGVEGALELAAALRWFWFAAGYFHEGRQRLEAALQRSASADPQVRARALTALAHVAFWQGDQRTVLTAARESVALLRGAGQPVDLIDALVAHGIGSIMTADAKAALVALDEAVTLARAQPRSTLLAFALFWYGTAAFEAGDHARAGDLLEECVAVGRVLHARPAIAHPLTNLGKLLCSLQQYERAGSCFREALGLHQEIDDRWGVMQVLVGIATIMHARGDHVSATRLLGAVQHICDDLGVHPPSHPHGIHEQATRELQAALGPQFTEAWQAGYELAFGDVVGYAETLLTSPETPLVAAGAARSQLPFAPLRVLALGPLQIQINGLVLAPDVWAYNKPKELFLYLLCHRGGRTRDQLSLVFWPDASPAQVKNSFHVTLHHMRKALGNDWVVFDGERYRINSDLGYVFDAELFETELSSLLRDVRAGQASVQRLRSALDLYQGDFADGEVFGDWHSDYRDRLLTLYLNGLLALGTLYLQQQNFDAAEETFQLLLLKDALHEEAFRQLMVTRARRGDRVRALAHYQRLTELLRNELGITPQAETIALFENIRQGQPV